MSSNTFTFPDGRRMQVPGLPAEIANRYKPGQMFKHQNSLPSLPVNPLEQTLRKYLQAVEVQQSIKNNNYYNQLRGVWLTSLNYVLCIIIIILFFSPLCRLRNWSELKKLSMTSRNREEWERSCRKCSSIVQTKWTTGYVCVCVCSWSAEIR